MKKGITSSSFAPQDAKTVISMAKEAGFNGVEWALGNDGPLRMDTTASEMTELHKMVKDAGLEVYSVANNLCWDDSLTSDDAASVQRAEDRIKKQLELAEALGCNTVLVIPGAVSVPFAPNLGVTPYGKVYERALSAVSKLADIAASHKVKIGLENVWNGFLLSPIEMRDFIDAINHPYVGSYFDVGNVCINGYPEHWISVLGKRIFKVHFKDFLRSVGTLDGFCAIGCGDVDYNAVVKALEAIGYDDFVTGEMVPPNTKYPDLVIKNTSYAMDCILKK